ncbi:hypothetical protein WICPIJ_005703 [Wickerhamomyces pijperi]|uniref:Uncharacterized protein n=1 Tax=Wickerhamomyces pijperi TaxID=599730 RepID=A0A9P8Q581_WICPI|nr:hypothetical protein WICPIJ_005703 [Wickerhamomyces pijperi]
MRNPQVWTSSGDGWVIVSVADQIRINDIVWIGEVVNVWNTVLNDFVGGVDVWLEESLDERSRWDLLGIAIG